MPIPSVLDERPLTVDIVRVNDSQFTKYEIITPVATMIWKRPVILPRTSLGAHSDTKAGETAEMPPIPNPEMTRPA